jgi:chorismate mutase
LTNSGVPTGDAIQAVRHMGVPWEYVPVMGAGDSSKYWGLPRSINLILLWNTTKSQKEIKHIYLRGTESQRTAGVAEVAGPIDQDISPKRAD